MQRIMPDQPRLTETIKYHIEVPKRGQAAFLGARVPCKQHWRWVVSSGLAEARIDVKVTGTLEEQPASGDVTRRDVEGTLRIRWTAKAGPANTTLAINHQGTPVSVQLNAVGQARLGEATVTVNVPVAASYAVKPGIGFTPNDCDCQPVGRAVADTR